MADEHTCFIAGHARLPQGMAAKSVFETLTITAEIDRTYGVILEASCTLATDHSRHYIGRILRGMSLAEGVDNPIEALERHYRGKAANALIAAMRDMQERYEEMDHEKERGC